MYESTDKDNPVDSTKIEAVETTRNKERIPKVLRRVRSAINISRYFLPSRNDWGEYSSSEVIKGIFPEEEVSIDEKGLFIYFKLIERLPFLEESYDRASLEAVLLGLKPAANTMKFDAEKIFKNLHELDPEYAAQFDIIQDCRAAEISRNPYNILHSTILRKSAALEVAQMNHPMYFPPFDNYDKDNARFHLENLISGSGIATADETIRMALLLGFPKHDVLEYAKHNHAMGVIAECLSSPRLLRRLGFNRQECMHPPVYENQYYYDGNNFKREFRDVSPEKAASFLHRISIERAKRGMSGISEDDINLLYQCYWILC